MSEQNTWCAQVPFIRVVIYLPVDVVVRWVGELEMVEVKMEGPMKCADLELRANEARLLTEAVQLRPKFLAWSGKLCREQILAGVRGPIILAAPNSDV